MSLLVTRALHRTGFARFVAHVRDGYDEARDARRRNDRRTRRDALVLPGGL